MNFNLPSEKAGHAYSIPEVYNILRQNLLPVESYPSDRLLDECKYVRLARRHHYTNYKLFFYKDIRSLNLLSSFSPFQLKFFAYSGCTVGIFNTLNDNLVSIVWRATDRKEFMNYSMVYTVYGYDLMLPTFKYHDWIVLTEGIYDADTLRQIYPNVLATLTSNVTVDMAAVLRFLSDRFIIAYDSDKAGQVGFMHAVKRLNTDGKAIIRKLPIFPGDKDVGVMEEVLQCSNDEFKLRYDFYSTALKSLMDDNPVDFVFR